MQQDGLTIRIGGEDQFNLISISAATAATMPRWYGIPVQIVRDRPMFVPTVRDPNHFEYRPTPPPPPPPPPPPRPRANRARPTTSPNMSLRWAYRPSHLSRRQYYESTGREFASPQRMPPSFSTTPPPRRPMNPPPPRSQSNSPTMTAMERQVAQLVVDNEVDENTGSDTKGDSRRCVVCLDAEPNAVIMSCRHMKTCFSCTERVRCSSGRCPVCRQQIDHVIKVFI